MYPFKTAIRKIGFLFLMLAPHSLLSCADKPRVSVISFLDEYSSIDRTVSLIAEQTCAPQIELILVDTGIINADGAREYSRHSSRIQVFHANSVRSKCELLNDIIFSCSGDYIIILSSGDTLNPHTIEEYLNAFASDSTLDVIYGNSFIRYEPYTGPEDGPGWYWVNKPDFDPSLLYYNLPGQQCMWRKALHTKCGTFDPQYQFFYQLEFWNRAYTQGAHFKKISITSGKCYLPYGTWKKLFNSPTQNELGYQEMQNLQRTYNTQWKKELRINQENKSLVIVTPSYKNAEWYKQNLDSMLNQKYDNYRIIYIDDASPDNTGHLVAEYLKERQQEHKITLIRNTQRVGALANIYTAVHMCKPEEIIILVDGDDWLAHDQVLTKINEMYQNPNVWATYGQFMWFPFGLEGFSVETAPWVIQNNSFRSAAWSVTHLRTFYAKLFQLIKKDDLLYEDGKFYPMTWDLAIMYPIMEMCGTHSAFVPDILYIYNSENSINDNKVNVELQGKCGQHVLCRPPYQPLAELFS